MPPAAVDQPSPPPHTHLAEKAGWGTKKHFFRHQTFFPVDQQFCLIPNKFLFDAYPWKAGIGSSETQLWHPNQAVGGLEIVPLARKWVKPQNDCQDDASGQPRSVGFPCPLQCWGNKLPPALRQLSNPANETQAGQTLQPTCCNVALNRHKLL